MRDLKICDDYYETCSKEVDGVVWSLERYGKSSQSLWKNGMEVAHTGFAGDQSSPIEECLDQWIETYMKLTRWEDWEE